MAFLKYAGVRWGAAFRPAGGLLSKDVLVQVREYLLDHQRVFNTGDDLDFTTALTAGFNVNVEYPYMDSSSFASTLLMT